MPKGPRTLRIARATLRRGPRGRPGRSNQRLDSVGGCATWGITNVTLAHAGESVSRPVDYNVLRIRSDKYQHLQARAGVIRHAMFLAGWRHCPLSRSQQALFVSHLKFPLPFQNKVHLVLRAMHVSLLLLARFEAVHVAKQPRGLKDIVLLHLLTAKLLTI